MLNERGDIKPCLEDITRPRNCKKYNSARVIDNERLWSTNRDVGLGSTSTGLKSSNEVFRDDLVQIVSRYAAKSELDPPGPSWR